MKKLLTTIGAIALMTGAPQDGLAIYRDAEKTFAIEFPDNSRVTRDARVVTLFGRRIPTRMYGVASQSLQLSVMVMDSELKADPGNRTAAEIAEDVIQGAFSAGAIPIRKREGPTTQDGCAVRGAVGDKPGFSAHHRVHVCAHHVFQVLAISRSGIESNSVARRFSDSFRVTGAEPSNPAVSSGGR